MVVTQNLGDVVINQHLDKCFKLCLTNIRGTESQSGMEKPKGKMCFLI